MGLLSIIFIILTSLSQSVHALDFSHVKVRAGIEGNGDSRVKNSLEDLFQLDDQLLDTDSMKLEFWGSNLTNSFTENAGFLVFKSRKWPAGVLPVSFHSSARELKNFEQKKRLFYDACEYWGSIANVRCVPRSKQSTYLEVRADGKGCYSAVGFKRFRKRVMNLSVGCWAVRTLSHEIGHAFGLLHEHQRKDRDLYIDIVWSNVKTEKRGAFSVLDNYQVSRPYDFGSVMHYWDTAFTKNGQKTIKVKKNFSDKQDVFSVSSYTVRPSESDLKLMARIYAEPPVKPLRPGLNSTVRRRKP